MTDRTRADSSFDHAEPPEEWLPRVKIRLLEKTDLPALEWEGEFSQFRRIYAEVYRRSSDGLAVAWVADLDPEGVIGQVFIQLRTNDPALADGSQRAYLHSFRVRPAYRGAGLGGQLMAIVLQDLIERGFSQLCLNVAKENLGAKRFYERLGYDVIGPDPGRWSYYDQHGILRQVSEPGWRMLKNF